MPTLPEIAKVLDGELTPIPTDPLTASPLVGAATLPRPNPMTVFPFTLKVEPAVVVPIPTLPWTIRPLVGAARIE